MLYIEYIEEIHNQNDNVFRSRLCGDFSRCFITNKEIKEILHWFTKSLHDNNVIDWDTIK